MRYKKLFLSWIVLVGFCVSLYAAEYHTTSFYVAYDKEDQSQFVLVMPSVGKIYTHKAGRIHPNNLTQISEQFISEPTYKDGTLCFSALKEGASGERGASVMAGKCYRVSWFYTQKSRVDNRMVFLLTYMSGENGVKVYEGFAGEAASFTLVKEGERVYNAASTSKADYGNFRFDVKTATVYGVEEEKKRGMASVSGTVGQLHVPVTAEIELDVNKDGIFDGMDDRKLVTVSEKGVFSLDHIDLPTEGKLKGQLSVVTKGHAPFQEVIEIGDGDALSVDASAATRRPILKTVVNLENLSAKARSERVVVFGLRQISGRVTAYSRVVPLRVIREKSETVLGEGTLSRYVIATERIPAYVKKLEVTMQSFDPTEAGEMAYFPAVLKGEGYAENRSSSLAVAAFDMFIMRDQEGRYVILPRSSTGEKSEEEGDTSCSALWIRRLTELQAERIRGWGDANPDTPVYDIPIWSDDLSHDAWQYVGMAHFYDSETSPYFTLCVPEEWRAYYLSAALPVAEKKQKVCIEASSRSGNPVPGLKITGKTERGDYTFGYTDHSGSLTLKIGDEEGITWLFLYSNALTGWSNIAVESELQKAEGDCQYRLHIDDIVDPYSAEVKVTAYDRDGVQASNRYVLLQHMEYGSHTYSHAGYTDENGTVSFRVEPEVAYKAHYNAGTASVEVDGEVVAPETADSGRYADLSLTDQNQAPYLYLNYAMKEVDSAQAEYMMVNIVARDANPSDILKLVSLKLGGREVKLDYGWHYAANAYYFEYGELNVSGLDEGNHTIEVAVSDGKKVTKVSRSFMVTRNRLPVIESSLVVKASDNTASGMVYVRENGTVLEKGSYSIVPYVYDPDGDRLEIAVSVDGKIIEADKPVDFREGKHEINVTASDGTGSSVRSYGIEVGNARPVITQFTVSPNPLYLDQGDQVHFSVYASDFNGDTIKKVIVKEKESGEEYHLKKNSEGYFSLDIKVPEEENCSKHIFEAIATDSRVENPASSIPKTVAQVIRKRHLPPYFVKGLENLHVHLGETVYLEVTVKDPDMKRIVTYWKIDGSPYDGRIEKQEGGSFGITLQSLSEGSHQIMCRAIDEDGMSTEVNASITVENEAPRFIHYPASQHIHIGKPISLLCEATDQDLPITYIWKVDGEARHETGTNLEEGNHTVSCTAVDKYGKRNEGETVTLSVENDKPVFSTYPVSQKVHIGTEVTLVCEATDQDTPVAYEWNVDDTIQSEVGTRLSLNYHEEGNHERR